MTQFLESTEDIKHWLKAHYIRLYTIHEDMSVDVEGDVYIARKNLDRIPVQFNRVSGDFDCGFNRLESLRGSPQMVGGNFNCEHNGLATLQEGPIEVGERFYCDHNRLVSLEGAPQRVGFYFSCSNNRLVNLEFCPEKVGFNFFCDHNLLLGDLQKIEDFSLIHQAHLKYKAIKEERENLCNSINANIKNKAISKI